MNAKLTPNEISLFLSLRSLTDVAAQKAMRKQLFTAIKTRLGIPAKHAIKFDDNAIINGAHSTAYLQRKKTGEYYELHLAGKWVGWADRPAPAPVAAPVTTTSTVYPTYVQGASPRRFFGIDDGGVGRVLDFNSFDEGIDSLRNVVTDKQVDYEDGRGLRRTIILADNTMYAEFAHDEL